MTKTDRPLSLQTYSQTLYEADHDEVVRICRESGREPTDQIRDLVSEALSIRRGRPAVATEILRELQALFEQNCLLIEQNRLASEKYQQLLEKSEKLEDRWDSLKQGLIQNLREFYAMLLEMLSASIGARNLTWKYVARVILEKSGFNKEQIQARYAEEQKAWIQERERIAEQLEDAVRNISSSGLDDVDHDLRLKTPGSGDTRD